MFGGWGLSNGVWVKVVVILPTCEWSPVTARPPAGVETRGVGRSGRPIVPPRSRHDTTPADARAAPSTNHSLPPSSVAVETKCQCQCQNKYMSSCCEEIGFTNVLLLSQGLSFHATIS